MRRQADSRRLMRASERRGPNVCASSPSIGGSSVGRAGSLHGERHSRRSFPELTIVLRQATERGHPQIRLRSASAPGDSRSDGIVDSIQINGSRADPANEENPIDEGHPGNAVISSRHLERRVTLLPDPIDAMMPCALFPTLMADRVGNLTRRAWRRSPGRSPVWPLGCGLSRREAP